MKLLVLCTFLVCYSSPGKGIGEVIYEGKTFVDHGSKVSMSCHVSLFEPQPIRWLKDGKKIPVDIPGYKQETIQTPTGFTAILTISSAIPFDTGEYKCNSFSENGHLLLVVSDALIEVNYDLEGVKLLKPGKALIIQCNTTENPGFSIKWYKNNQEVVTNDHLKLLDMNHTLQIEHPKETDAGIYVCQADSSLITNSIHTELNQTIVVHMDPFVEPFDISKNLVEGEKLILECKVHGYPDPEVSWFIGDIPIEKLENSSRVTIRTEPDSQSSYLEIEDVNLNDRNNYKCLALGSFNSSESTILVRIKGRYAALWPFLGIVAEVVILCTIIFFYERRRNKAALDESDTEPQASIPKTTPDHPSDVRQRK